jgi:hypothetical protein
MGKDQIIGGGTADPDAPTRDMMLDRGECILPCQLRAGRAFRTLAEQRSPF